MAALSLSSNDLARSDPECNADGFKLAMYLISRALEGIDARIVHTQHDEINVEARDGIEDQVREIVKETMEEAFQGIIPEVPFVAEIRVAEAWGDKIQ
ncbi:MAG: DNA polymerase [Syntrophobacteraceae bacterium]